jgi:hypothetical protein
MARTPGSGTSTSIKIAARPDTAIGHAAAAKDHSRAAAAHAAKAEALSRDTKRSLPKSAR